MNGATTEGVKALLCFEGACILFAATMAYSWFGLRWKAFALYFFLPDVSCLGYLVGPGLDSTSYNAIHSYLGAGLPLIVGISFSPPPLGNRPHLARSHWVRSGTWVWAQILLRLRFHALGIDGSCPPKRVTSQSLGSECNRMYSCHR